MPVNYNAAVKTARVTATRDYFANGTMEIQDAQGEALVIFELGETAGAISGDAWSLNFDAETIEAIRSGTAAKAVIKNSQGNAHITGLTVGESDADVTIDNTDINSGQSVTMSSAVIQHAA